MRKLSFVLIPLLIVTVLLLAPGIALADEGGEGDEIDIPTDPAALIDYLKAIPIGIAVSALLEWVAIKNWPWFRNLNPAWRFFIILGLYLLYPCLVTFGGYVNDSISGVTVDSEVVKASYYSALFQGGMAWVAAIVTHRGTKAKATTG